MDLVAEGVWFGSRGGSAEAAGPGRGGGEAGGGAGLRGWGGVVAHCGHCLFASVHPHAQTSCDVKYKPTRTKPYFCLNHVGLMRLQLNLVHCWW